MLRVTFRPYEYLTEEQVIADGVRRMRELVIDMYPVTYPVREDE